MLSLGMRAVVLAATTAFAMPAMAETKLTFSTYVPASYSVTACDTFFMDEVAKRTNGEVTFEKYYSGSLLNAADTYTGLGRGAADVANGAPAGYQRLDYPLTNLIIPFATSDPIASTKAFNDLIHEGHFDKEYEKHNIKLLHAVITAEHTVWTKESVRSIADLKGKRIRALLATGDALDKMGATVVAMSFPDALEAMSRGAVDGFGNLPFDLAVTAGVYKTAKHASDIGGMGVFSAQTFAINLDSWKKLSPEVQKTMVEVSAEVPDNCWNDLVKKDVRNAVDTLKKEQGIEVTTFSAEEAQQLRDTIGKELRDEWLAMVAKHGYDGETLLSRYEELVRKYEQTSGYKTGFAQYAE